MALARMRTIRQCYEYFKEKDPDSSISEYYLRRLAKQNKIPVFYAGRKQLVNLDRLIDYLNSNSIEEMPNTYSGYGQIRRVRE